jgi:dTDP-4-amino-4,6-dideoxygalactose transaminase
MVSRENAVVVSSGVVALLLGYGGLWLTDLGTEVLIGTILFVGVVAPQLVNGYLDRKQEM